MPATEPVNLKEKVRHLPDKPGVYLMKDRLGRIIYVGKAKSLKKRVSSYFQKTQEDPRIALMVKNIARVEFTIVPTEIDALVLESRLIKVEKPHYNLQLREGSGYPYLHLSPEKGIPQLQVHRGKRGKTGRYFGPFPSRDAVYRSHDLLQKHFGWNNCKLGANKRMVSTDNLQKNRTHLRGKGNSRYSYHSAYDR